MSVPERPSRRPPMPFEPAEPAQGAIQLAVGEAPNDAFLFELAWEVCNQVGGIYQVIRSKLPLMSHRYGDNYCLIGPYVESRAQHEFEPTPATGFLGRIVEALRSEGMTIHHGRWLVQAKPCVLLIELDKLKPKLAEAKYLLWEHHGIESPAHHPGIDDAILFGEAARLILQTASDVAKQPGALGQGLLQRIPQRIIAHCHEWQTGLTIAALRRSGVPVSTVFTTHATLLGRYMASSEENFYERLPYIDAERGAAYYNLRAEHAIEKLSAQSAHVFTTVSQITAEECRFLLGRKPDVITPNGLTITRYNVGHDFQTFHADFKERLHAFTQGYFFPHYSFDLDRTLYFFTSGRFEPSNKGFDLCLEAMARLNAQLKAQKSGTTVVFFIVTPRPVRSLNPKVLEKRAVLNELHGVCSSMVSRVGEQLFRRASAGEPLALDALVEEYWHLRYRRTQSAFRSPGLPPVVTHILEDDQHDPVLNQIRTLGLFNLAEDPVKIVYHPEFINPVNPLWGIEYEQFVRGCHLGLFPSAYEPWGYTPLECMALGTPAISSDLAGFGRYVQETYEQPEKWGLTVLPRRGHSFHDAARDLSQRLHSYCLLTRRDRVELRNEVERRSWDFDWSRVGAGYEQAHELALKASYPDQTSTRERSRA